MTTVAIAEPPKKIVDKSPDDICVALNELRENCRSKSKFFRESLQAVAEHFGSPYASIRITLSASSMKERVVSDDDDTEVWESATEELLLESQARNVPIARLYNIQGTSLQAAALAAPICEGTSRPMGAISLIARCENATIAKAYLGELRALVSLIVTNARLIQAKAPLVRQDDSPLKRAVVKASDFQSLHELAFAVTNSLKNKFTCDQVTLGLVQKTKVKILSISGLDNVYPKSPGVKHIRQAMEECLDRGNIICYQEEDKWSDSSVVTNHCLHRLWYENSGNAPVLSVPLMLNDKCIAVLSMSRSRKIPFTEDELATIHEVVTPFASAIQLVAKADRGLLRHLTDAVNNGGRWILAPRSLRRKAFVLAVLASIAYFSFATVNYEVTMPSQITPTEIHCFASPFEGTIKACHVNVGDEVVQGQLLYEMDTTDLQLQRDKLESDLAVLRLQTNQALISEAPRSAAMAGAEIRVVQSQLAIIQHSLAGAQVVAPSSGTVVSGDLIKRIGEVVPMGEPLLELVPNVDLSIELLASETMMPELEVGFEGQFACNARPGELLECKIIRIRPRSELVDGKNIFVAEATVNGNPTWMRAGMEGVTQIDAGTRPVWWIASHRVINYIQLNFWR